MISSLNPQLFFTPSSPQVNGDQPHHRVQCKEADRGRPDAHECRAHLDDADGGGQAEQQGDHRPRGCAKDGAAAHERPVGAGFFALVIQLPGRVTDGGQQGEGGVALCVGLQREEEERYEWNDGATG